MVRSPWTSFSVAKGMTGFRPVWSSLELKSDSAMSAVDIGRPRRSEPQASWFVQPPPTALMPFMKSRRMR